MAKQFVPALRSDLKPGAHVRINYEHNRGPARDVRRLFGVVTDHPVTMRRGDLMFQIDCGGGPVMVRHGDYTGTEIRVEVDVEKRCKEVLAARKRWYRQPEPSRPYTLIGGPLAGSQLLVSAFTGCGTTLPFTLKGQTGRYEYGVWQGAKP